MWRCDAGVQCRRRRFTRAASAARGRGSVAARERLCPQLWPRSWRSRCRSEPEQSALPVVDPRAQRCLLPDMRHAPPTSCALVLPLRVLYGGSGRSTARRPAGVGVRSRIRRSTASAIHNVTGPAGSFSRLLGTRSACQSGRESSAVAVFQTSTITLDACLRARRPPG